MRQFKDECMRAYLKPINQRPHYWLFAIEGHNEFKKAPYVDATY